MRPPSPALTHNGQITAEVVPNETIRGMNFVRNSYETARRIREGVTRQGKARESFGSQLKASSNLFSMGAASAASKIPKSDPDVTLNNLSSTGIYVPEDFNRATLGAFVTKGRFSGNGAPAAPFLMSSGLSRTIDVSKKQPDIPLYHPNTSGTQSANSIGNRIRAQISTPATNSQPKQEGDADASHREQHLDRIPSFKAFGADDPTVRAGRLWLIGRRASCRPALLTVSKQTGFPKIPVLFRIRLRTDKSAANEWAGHQSSQFSVSGSRNRPHCSSQGFEWRHLVQTACFHRDRSCRRRRFEKWGGVFENSPGGSSRRRCSASQTTSSRSAQTLFVEQHESARTPGVSAQVCQVLGASDIARDLDEHRGKTAVVVGTG